MSVRSERIKMLIADSGLSYMDIEKITKVKKSSLQRYASGETEKIPLEVIEKLSDAFGVSRAYLMGWDEEIKVDNLFTIETKKFPLLGRVACGEPIFADGDRELYVEAGANIKADFCLRARGDSMIGARIQDGDIVFIHQQEMVEDGEIAAVLIEDEATLKRVQYNRSENELLLFAENPKYKTMRFTGEELNHIRILGKAVAFQSDVK